MYPPSDSEELAAALRALGKDVELRVIDEIVPEPPGGAPDRWDPNGLAALEMIENRILEAEQELYQARMLEGKDQHAMAVNKAYRAVLAAPKAVLVPEGIDPNTDAETLSEFDQRFGKTGRIATGYSTPILRIGDLGPKETTAALSGAVPMTRSSSRARVTSSRGRSRTSGGAPARRSTR